MCVRVCVCDGVYVGVCAYVHVSVRECVQYRIPALVAQEMENVIIACGEHFLISIPEV
jgi:hypothetical protein